MLDTRLIEGCILLEDDELPLTIIDKIKIKDMLICFDRIHECGGQTDSQTDGHRMTAYGRAYA